MSETAALKEASPLPESTEQTPAPARPGDLGTEAAVYAHETTSYIAAYLHRDWVFRRQVIEELANSHCKAIAPSYGVDLDFVLLQAKKARRRKTLRDLLLVATFAIPFFEGNFAGHLAYVVGSAPEMAGELVETYISVLALTLGVAFLVVFIETLVSDYIVPKRLLASRSAAKTGDGSDDASASDSGNRRNVIFYGGFVPFVGAGLDMGGWSFSIKTTKGKENMGESRQPRSFELVDLYRFVTEGIESLHLAGLTVRDQLYVDGQAVRDDERFLPHRFSRPLDRLEPEDLEKYVGHSSCIARHYKQIQVSDWYGELVVTILLRFVKTEDHLFTEANYFLLPPLKPELHELDERPTSLFMRRFNAILFKSLGRTPFLWIASPLFVLGRILSPITEWQQKREVKKQIRNNPRFNYGAKSSLRERAGATEYRTFFQKLDKQMYLKIVEKQVLDLIVDFLDAHDVDTSELRDRQTAILNNGVIVSGGSVEAENLAVGQNAKAASRWLGQGGGHQQAPQAAGGKAG